MFSGVVEKEQNVSVICLTILFSTRDTTFNARVGMTENCEFKIPMIYV